MAAMILLGGVIMGVMLAFWKKPAKEDDLEELDLDDLEEVDIDIELG